MPQRRNRVVRPYRRPTNGQAIMHGLASGARIAYNNRAALWQLGRSTRNAIVEAKNAIVSYRNKKKAASKPKTKKKSASKTGETGGSAQYTQQDWIVKSTGKKLPTNQLIKKAVLSNITPVIYQFKKYKNDGENTANLATDLGHWVAGGIRYLPLYILDLTRINQPNLAMGGQGALFKRCIMDTAGTGDGKIKWLDIPAEDAYTNPILTWDTIQRNSVSTTNTYKSLLEYVNIKANVMGPRNRATKVKFSLVYLPNDMDPFEGYDYNQDGTENAQHNAAWIQYVSKLTVNNIHNRVKTTYMRPKVIAEKTLLFQPTSTTESDVRGHIDTLKWFWRCNKTLNYHDGAGDSQTINPVDDITIQQPVVARQVGTGTGARPIRGKVFLLISAFAPYAEGSYSNLTHPSFEWNFQAKHVKLA